jgi:CheY-like chemotaxis protein
MWQENRPPFFDDLVRELRRLCQEKRSGTLFITTEGNHSARLVLREGVVVGVTYRTKHGPEAIPLIKNIMDGHYTFSENHVFLSYSESTAAPLPGTPEILRLLGVGLEIPAQPVSAQPAVSSTIAAPPARPTYPVSAQPAVSSTMAAPPAKPAYPVSAQPAALPTTVAPAARPVKGNPLPSAKKILVVDDSDVTRKLIAKLLIQDGYAVLEAENGMAAFARLNEESPDLILLDIVMPGIDGYKVLSMVRKHEKFKSLPVIMMTSKVSLLDRLRGKMDGSIEYLAKPFTSGQLVEKLTIFFHQTGKMIYELAV